MKNNNLKVLCKLMEAHTQQAVYLCIKRKRGNEIFSLSAIFKTINLQGAIENFDEMKSGGNFAL